jgi:hypothetical protein
MRTNDTNEFTNMRKNEMPICEKLNANKLMRTNDTNTITTIRIGVAGTVKSI